MGVPFPGEMVVSAQVTEEGGLLLDHTTSEALLNNTGWQSGLINPQELHGARKLSSAALGKFVQ